jgi:multicomponent Na+:H+ antiporter subunit G
MSGLELASGTLLALGGLFILVGGIGILRLPDFFTRLHASGLNDTMGAALVLIGLMVAAGFTLVSAKLALILFFLLFTAPTSTHALAKAALLGGLKPWTKPKDEPSSKT